MASLHLLTKACYIARSIASIIPVATPTIILWERFSRDNPHLNLVFHLGHYSFWWLKYSLHPLQFTGSYKIKRILQLSSRHPQKHNCSETHSTCPASLGWTGTLGCLVDGPLEGLLERVLAWSQGPPDWPETFIWCVWTKWRGLSPKCCGSPLWMHVKKIFPHF